MFIDELAQAFRNIEDALAAVQVLRDKAGRTAGGRELALTYTKLEEALHWLTDADKALQAAE